MLTRVFHAPEFTFPGLYGEIGGICDVQMFQGDSLRALVIVSEPVLRNGSRANPGVIVMCALPDIITILVNLIPMNVLRVSFVLHTPTSLSDQGREFFGLCSFDWNLVDDHILMVDNTHIWDWSRADLEWLIGAPFVLEPLDDHFALI